MRRRPVSPMRLRLRCCVSGRASLRSSAANSRSRYYSRSRIIGRNACSSRYAAGTGYALIAVRGRSAARSWCVCHAPFSDQILWPEFLQLNKVLQAHLLDITVKLIRDHVHADAGDAEEMAEKGCLRASAICLRDLAATLRPGGLSQMSLTRVRADR